MATKQTTEVRQQQIIDAARKLIFKFGSEHLTVKKIAEEVGFTEAAIYRHFKGKKEILSFLLVHIESVLLWDIEQGKAEEPMTLERIEQTIQKHFSAIDLRKGVSFQVIAEIISLGDRRLNRQASQTLNRYINALEQLLAEGVKSGCIRTDLDLAAAAVMLFGIIQGLVNLWSLDSSTFALTQRFASQWEIYRELLISR